MFSDSYHEITGVWP